METISVRLSGELFVDVFAYRGHIYGWNFENQLVIYSVQDLIDQLGASYGARGLSAAYALFCSRGIGASSEMKEAFRDREANRGETLVLRPSPLARIENVSSFKHVIDFRITYDRVYVATEVGLFVGPLRPRQIVEEGALVLELEHEGECLAVSTGLRAVGASFGTKGLYVVTNESSERLGPRKSWLLPVTSVRSSLGASTLANFPSHEEVQEIPVSVSRGQHARDVALDQITETDPEVISRSTDTFSGYIFWDPRYRRMFDVVQQTEDQASRWFVDPDEAEFATQAVVPDVVSAMFTGNYSLVMETTAGIVAVRSSGDELIQDGSVISMRTFRNSWRYRRLVATTSAEGIWLHATLD